MLGRSWSLIVLAMAATSSVKFAAGGRVDKECPAGKGVCVESWRCKASQWTGSKQHKCFLPNKMHGVCCDGCKMKNKKLHCPTQLYKQEANSMSEESQSGSAIGNGFPSCQTPTMQPGRCVAPILCDDLHTLLSQRSTKGYQLKRFPSCSSKSTSVCCPHNPDDRDSLIRHPKARKFNLNKCGSVAMTDRIVGGNVAELGEYPWMANIMYHKRYKSKTEKKALCSGSLIHPRYVLTAAHCAEPSLNPVSVRLGDYDLSTDKDCVGNSCMKRFIERSIRKWIVHRRYSKRTKKADIALIELWNEAKIIPGQISPICLPLTRQWLMTKPLQPTVTGWGMTENEKSPDRLRYADLRLVNHSQYCRDEDVICARGANMEGTCQGDSGGPLQQIVPRNGTWRMVLFGVVAAGAVECSRADETPGVFTLVGYYLRWILDNVQI